MLIDLHELLQENDGVRKYQPAIENDSFIAKECSYKVKDSHLIITFHNKGKNKLDCSCSGFVILVMPCDRCLQDVDCKINIDYFEELDMNMTEQERIDKLDEEPFLQGKEFDFELFIHNEILVNLPMKVLCSNNCKGICNRCGANLNMGSCKCDDAELDPRMSKILDVFNQFKEV